MEYYDEGFEEAMERDEKEYRRRMEDEETDGEIKLYSLKDLLAVLLVVVLLTAAAVFTKLIYTYEMPVFDPRADLKATIMDIEVMFAACATGFLIISIALRNNARRVHHWVVAALIFSFLMTISLLAAKVYMDTMYDSNSFIEFYENKEYRKQIGNVTLEDYVIGSKEGYQNFTIKCTVNLIINMFIIGIELRFFKRTNEIMIRQEKIRAHDAALFDTEVNVKI